MASIGAEDSALQTSKAELSTVKSVLAVVISKATTVTIPEVPVMTSMLTEPVAGIVSAPSKMASTSTNIIHTIIEKGSGSALTELAPAMDIMEELAHQMVQFFTSMKSYIKFVLSRRSSFEFAQMLLKNQIENIRHTGSSDKLSHILCQSNSWGYV